MCMFFWWSGIITDVDAGDYDLLKEALKMANTSSYSLFVIFTTIKKNEQKSPCDLPWLIPLQYIMDCVSDNNIRTFPIFSMCP